MQLLERRLGRGLLGGSEHEAQVFEVLAEPGLRWFVVGGEHLGAFGFHGG